MKIPRFQISLLTLILSTTVAGILIGVNLYPQKWKAPQSYVAEYEVSGDSFDAVIKSRVPITRGWPLAIATEEFEVVPIAVAVQTGSRIQLPIEKNPTERWRWKSGIPINTLVGVCIVCLFGFLCERIRVRLRNRGDAANRARGGR